MKCDIFHDILFLLLFIIFLCKYCKSDSKQCLDIKNFNDFDRIVYSKAVIPALEGKRKGEAGKICIIGGSVEYTGAPYFAAITSLKVGADLVYVVTTIDAAPVIKSYSPELIVYPYLNKKQIYKTKALLPKMDVIVIGPGLGRENETLGLIYDIIDTCKELKKPLVIDADGLYAISKNLSVLSSYPSPGVLLTPNHHEADKLNQAMHDIFYENWGSYIGILTKGKEDKFYSNSLPLFGWTLSAGGSARRAGGQGDILAGTLGTFYNWALKADICVVNGSSVHLAQSIATYASAKFTRDCNAKAFALHGRSMTASDMLNVIHVAFEELFEDNNHD